MSVQPHGTHLLLSSPTTVRIWDPDGDRLVARFEGFEEAVDALPLDGDIIVSEYETGSVVRFDPASPDDRTVIASGLDAPAGLAVHGGDPVCRWIGAARSCRFLTTASASTLPVWWPAVWPALRGHRGG